MKEVWLLRHGPQDVGNDPTVWHRDAPLSVGGLELVKRVAETQLKGIDFSFYGSSPFRRAKETAAIVAVGPAEIPELAPISEAAWDWIFQTHPEYLGTISNLPAFFAKEPGLMIAEGDRVFTYIRQVVAWYLREGQKALLVSHQPLIEMALAVATNTFPPQLALQKGEIVIFYFEGDKFSGWKRLPLP